MLTSVAVLPQPPLLVPELATGAAAETTSLRAACLAAAARLGATARHWIAVGADEGGRQSVDPQARGTFAGYGVDVVVALDTGSPGGVRGEAPDPMLALPLLIAGWVAAAAAVDVSIRGELVAPDAPAAECAEVGRALATELAAVAEPVGLLVVGDGASTHTEKAPGHLDERAGPFDAAVATALAGADTAALAALDPVLARQLHAVGRAPWQVLAAAAGAGWTGELLYSQAPYGVAYHVAYWMRRP
ncbi:MAG: hypothetical protein AB7J32_11520 [Pseudonocardia sp.]